MVSRYSLKQFPNCETPKMTSKYNYAAFILTHGRPHNVLTYNTLRKYGYTGRVVIVIDNEDKTGDDYRKVFGEENVVMFDKAAIGKTFDIADTRTDRRATVFARNAAFDIARDLGLDYHIQLDDDYQWFGYRKLENGVLRGIPTKKLDALFEALIDFMEASDAVTVAMSQGGDHIGGSKIRKREFINRKAMNSWIFRTERPLTFVGRMNDDVNTYVMNGIRGEKIFTLNELCLVPAITQSLAGGMTEMYLDTGTYMKSMYTVMMAPSCVKVRQMGPTNPRLHHQIKWENTVPKIINQKHQKI